MAGTEEPKCLDFAVSPSLTILVSMSSSLAICFFSQTLIFFNPLTSFLYISFHISELANPIKCHSDLALFELTFFFFFLNVNIRPTVFMAHAARWSRSSVNKQRHC